MRKLAAIAALVAGPALADAPTNAPGPYLDIQVSGEASGTITIDLFEEIAPKHTARLAELAQAGAYDGVVFHRVIDGFMAQTGDVKFGRIGQNMNMAGTGGSDLPDLKAEFTTDVSFARGTIGMARSRDPNSANSQFFIMFGAAPHLDGEYTILGEVTAGMDVVDAIKRGAGRNGSVIGTPDLMETVTYRAK